VTAALKDAVAKAREHSKAIRKLARKAVHALADGNHGTAAEHLRELTDRCDRLDRAHDAIQEAPFTDATTAEEGAQVSDGQEPRDYSPEAIRQRDQLAGCVAGYNSRMRR